MKNPAPKPLLALSPLLFLLALLASMTPLSPTAQAISMRQHDTEESDDGIYARDVESFGVTDTLEFKGKASHSLNIQGGPSDHTIQTYKVGDTFSFNTTMEFSASRFGDDDGDGRPLFVPHGPGTLAPIGGTLAGLNRADRLLEIRNFAELLNGGMAGAVFDYSSPWAITIIDNIDPTDATTTTSVTLGGGGTSAGGSISLTKQVTSPTTVVELNQFDDLFQFLLSQPTQQQGVNADARQGFFAVGGIVGVTGHLRAVKPIDVSYIWMDNDTALTFDGIFEGNDANFPADEALPGGVGDLLLRDSITTIPWDKYRVVVRTPDSGVTLFLLAISLGTLAVFSRHTRAAPKGAA